MEYVMPHIDTRIKYCKIGIIFEGIGSTQNPKPSNYCLNNPP